jgi:hypothetical protein
LVVGRDERRGFTNDYSLPSLRTGSTIGISLGAWQPDRTRRQQKLRGDQVDQLFGRADSGTAYWLLTDRLGSNRASSTRASGSK